MMILRWLRRTVLPEVIGTLDTFCDNAADAVGCDDEFDKRNVDMHATCQQINKKGSARISFQNDDLYRAT